MNQSAIPAWLQIIWAVAGVGVAVGGLLWMLVIMWPYLRWTRQMMQRSFDLGAKTADHLDLLQRDLAPVITDLKEAVKDARAIVKELREKELEKITGIIDRITENGTVDEVMAAIKSLPGKIDALVASAKKDLAKKI